MNRLSDNYYVEKVRNGETSGFTPLLERYSKQVFSLIVKVTGNREDAEELTQDVFLKVYRSIDSFRGESSFSTWLYRIAYNIAVSATRKKACEVLPVDEHLMDSVADDSEDMFFDEPDTPGRVELLRQALELLTTDDRAMILLFYKEDRSMEEIAGITGLSETNVKTKIFRIRKKLLASIKEMEERRQ